MWFVSDRLRQEQTRVRRCKISDMDDILNGLSIYSQSFIGSGHFYYDHLRSWKTCHTSLNLNGLMIMTLYNKNFQGRSIRTCTAINTYVITYCS